MTEEYSFRRMIRKSSCAELSGAEMQIMRKSQPWEDLKEEHSNDLVSITYSVSLQ